MKFLLTIALLTALFFTAAAQTHILVRGGFNYSTGRVYYNDVKQPVDFIPGGNIGLQLKTAFDGLLHFSPYIGYSSRGFLIKSDQNTDKIRNLIHYIDIAPLLSVHIPANKTNKFVISAGPVAGFAIAGTEKKTIAGVTSSSKMKFSTTGNYGYFDFGLQAGMGYHFKKFFVEAAYQYGFVSINNEEERDKRNIRNRNFCLNIGYYIKSYK